MQMKPTRTENYHKRQLVVFLGCTPTSSKITCGINVDSFCLFAWISPFVPIQTQRRNNPGNEWLTSRKSARSDVWSVAPTHLSSSSSCYQSYVRYTANVSLSWRKHLSQQRRHLLNTVIIYIICTRLTKSLRSLLAFKKSFPSTNLLKCTRKHKLLNQNNKPIWGVKVRFVCSTKNRPATSAKFPRRKVPTTKAVTLHKIQSNAIVHVVWNQRNIINQNLGNLIWMGNASARHFSVFEDWSHTFLHSIRPKTCCRALGKTHFSTNNVLFTNTKACSNLWPILGIKLGHELVLAWISRQQSSHLVGRGHRFIISQNYQYWNLHLKLYTGICF